MSTEFNLVYDGVREENEESARRVQGIFASELELDAAGAAQLFAASPAIVKTSGDRSALERIYLILEEAGAYMRIEPVKPLPSEKVEVPLGPPLDLDAAIWDGSPKAVAPPPATPAPADDFGLELSVEPPSASTHPAAQPERSLQPPAPPAATELEFKLDSEPPSPAPQPEKASPQPAPSSEIEFSLSDSKPVESAAKPAAVPAPEPQPAPVDFGLSLDEPAKPAETTPKAAEPPPSAPPKPADPAAAGAAPADSDPGAAKDVPEFQGMRLADAQKVKREPPPPSPESAEPGAEQVEPEVAAESAAPHGGMSRRTMALIGVGGLVLVGALNWYLFLSGSGSADDARFEQVAATMKVEPPPPPPSIEEVPPVPADPFADLILNFAGSREDAEVKVSWKIETRGSALARIQIELAPPLPPELTPEEIVRGTPPHPGIRKVELDEMQLSYLEEGRFQGQGPAKVYIEQGESRRRLIVPALFEGAFKPGDRELSVAIVVSNWPAGEPEQNHAIESVPGADFNIFVRGSLDSLGTVPEPEAPAAEDPAASATP